MVFFLLFACLNLFAYRTHPCACAAAFATRPFLSFLMLRAYPNDQARRRQRLCLAREPLLPQRFQKVSLTAAATFLARS